MKGSVGCSGDLTPLAHLTLGLMGEGRASTPHSSGWIKASDALHQLGLEPLHLKAKEGIALINGTQLIVALGAEAVSRCQALARQADVIAALTLEALRGSSGPFQEAIHKLRPHPGQLMCAERIRNLLHSEHYFSAINDSHRDCCKVQDSYSLRCIPQVHGIVHDTINFAHNILATELNSATDNPLIFDEEKAIVSNGNFHGEYPGKALDYLAIGIHELSQISERRIERLLNAEMSHLPPFLVKDGGLNSGMMMVQVVAASLVSENKVLCHPSTADSIPTSCGQEDHVSMATFAARKALTVIENVEKVLAIELLCACQAMDFLKPLESTPPLHSVWLHVRKFIEPLDVDRVLSTDIQTLADMLREEQIWKVVEPYLEKIQEKQRVPSQQSSVSDRSSDSAFGGSIET